MVPTSLSSSTINYKIFNQPWQPPPSITVTQTSITLNGIFQAALTADPTQTITISIPKIVNPASL